MSCSSSSITNRKLRDNPQMGMECIKSDTYWKSDGFIKESGPKSGPDSVLRLQERVEILIGRPEHMSDGMGDLFYGAVQFALDPLLICVEDPTDKETDTDLIGVALADGLRDIHFRNSFLDKNGFHFLNLMESKLGFGKKSV